MAITDENNGTGMVMPVQPLGGGYGYGGGNNGGFGGWGSDWIILFLFAMMFGGWGGGFGGGFGGYGNMMLGYDFPWLLTGQQNINSNTNSGFRDAMINDNITSVRDGISGLSTQICGGFGDTQMSLANGFASTNLGIANGTAAIQNSLCNGFNSVNQGVNNAQNALAQQMYANQISDLERSFAVQTANTQGLTNLSAQLAQCCCDNRAATNDVKYTIATEACATRAANTANTQAILDKLCALELDTVKSQLAQAQRENVALQNAVNMATMQASQTAQTAQILAGQAAEIDGVYNRLKNCPVPSMPVYGNTPIFNCQSGGCGCGA